MTAVPQAEAIDMLQSLLDDLSKTESRLAENELAKDQEIKAVLDKFGPRVDALTTVREELVDRITNIYNLHRAFLTEGKGKLVVLRGGTLSAKFAVASLVVDDEKAAMSYIKRMGKLRVFTKLGKRTLLKDALKKNPEFVKKAPGIHLDQPENLTIKLPTLGIERIRRLHPLRTTLDRTD